MDRRRFLLTSLAGAVAAPFVVEAQTTRTYRVAMLGPFSTTEGTPYRDAFFDAMRALGYVDGCNVIFDVQVSDRDRARVPALVDELIALKPDVLVAGDANAAQVMRAKTISIPIVLTGSIDPVGDGLAQSLRQPGMNVTGVALFLDQLSAKHIDIMREILPRLTRVGLIFDTTSQNCKLIEEAAGEAARTARAVLVSYPVANREELERAFSRMVKERPEVLIPCPTPLLFNNRDLLYESAVRLRIPFTSFVVANVPVGVLFSYGPSFAEGYRKAATYVDKILKGAKPGDLPIEQPTTFELVINLKTAKAVGLGIPRSVLLRADRVIE